MPYLDSGNIKLFFQEKGKGQIIFLIHGWSFDSSIWTNQIDFLNKHWRVIAVDIAGHGLSEYKFGIDLCDGLLLLIKRYGYRDIIILGHSFGGVIALKLVLRNPELFNRLILVNTSPKFNNDQNFKLGLDGKDINKMKFFLQHNYPKILVVFYRWLFTENERRMSCFRKNWDIIVDRKHWPDRQALSDFLLMIEQTDLTANIEKIKIPTLIIYSKNDPICSKEAANYMHLKIPNSYLKVFDGGHLPFLMYREDFNQTLNNFLVNSNEPEFAK